VPVSVLSAWTFEPQIVLGLVLVAVVYVAGLRDLARRGRLWHTVKRYQPVLFALGLLSLVVALLSPVVASAQVPTGWQAITDGSNDYTVRTDGARREGGQGFAGATIKANVESPRGSAMLAQSIRADAYRGKRIRLSGYLKTIGVNEGTAVMFMRVDGEGVIQTSDFMQNRPLMMTNDWTRQEIVLDIPRTAVGFTYGFLLGGSGQAWLDDLSIDVVGNDVATTGHPGGLYPVQTNVSDRELDRRRRDQEVAYRRAADAPVNLALRANGGTVLVAARNNAP